MCSSDLTIHAIGPGLSLAEIQQNSNVTYRVFDYGRLGADGAPRTLHTEKALAVASCQPVGQQDFAPHLGRCGSFTVDRHIGSFRGMCGSESFQALLITEGAGMLRCGGERHMLHPGSCFFLPAGTGLYHIEGACQAVTVYIS